MHLGVFGGTFDPPHNGHLALSLFARELLGLEKIMISVSNNPFKRERQAADEHRKRMAELLSREINLTGTCSEVSGWELEKQQPSYTIDLLRYAHALYPLAHLTLLVGEESYREFASWKDSRQLSALCDIVVFRRAAPEDDRSAEETLPPKGSIRFIDFAYPLSSTRIRELVSTGESITRLVPPTVNRYIIEHGLYRPLP